MEKILFAIDPDGVNLQTLDFATYMCRLTRSGITGVFLEKQGSHPTQLLKRLFSLQEEGPSQVENYNDKYPDKDEMEEDIELFRATCENRSLRYTTLPLRGEPLERLCRETRFADLLVMDAFTTNRRNELHIPTAFVKEVLQETECPVVIAPGSFGEIDEIIFTYNGSRSSVFAMKQFTYLFPGLDEKRLIIVQANEKGEWEESEKNSLKELFQNHYSSIGFDIVKNAVEDELFEFLLGRKNAFIVMGAYGRAALSRFFRRSYADQLIRTMTQPIFIAHT